MNNKKRYLLKSAVQILEQAHDYVSAALEDEQDCLDNMPENLQSSEKYEKMEEAISNLESAIESIENAKDSIESASM